MPWEGKGRIPVGYGYDSIAAIIRTISGIEEAAAGLSPNAALQARCRIAASVDEQGLIATPANSSTNELVIEAARRSILNEGVPVRIPYEPTPHVEPPLEARRTGS